MNTPRSGFDDMAADARVYGDLDRAITQADRDRRRRDGALGALATAAVVLAMVAGATLFTDGEPDSRQPIGPATTTPAPAPTASASPEVRWEPPEPLRPAASRVVRLERDFYGNSLPWPDPGGATSAGIDIVAVAEGADFHGGSSWRFELGAATPRDPVGRIIGYGIVVDGDGDHRPDCQIGINNDAPKPRDFHVWVTNLRTHETAQRNGPPYGVPVEFAHPAEGGIGGHQPEMQFGFLTGLEHPSVCDPFGKSATFYAWASLTVGGEVAEQDFAPDAAWMPIRWYQ